MMHDAQRQSRIDDRITDVGLAILVLAAFGLWALWVLASGGRLC